MITWPGTLPQTLLVDGFANQFADNRLFADMDIGPNKVRRRGAANPEPLVGTIKVNGTQWATLRTFWITTTVGGTLRFQWNSPVPGFDLIELTFVEVPSRTALGADMYQVTLSMEVMP